ncbi:hypothetical protein [Actinacidiphila oryziradicis]|uniref:Uncharacterized protein n=1 Tax=Actinacidiphila oryziradicis TaxID=2571141 RepID=A0A4U0S213_9ACTN|nr:hypothetical protein [Actinacidiphila oryziradicis]TKA02886.1 hypothetical protein FCI23_38220 [Actinacidiphila oryziradicis]
MTLSNASEVRIHWLTCSRISFLVEADTLERQQRAAMDGDACLLPLVDQGAVARDEGLGG